MDRPSALAMLNDYVKNPALVRHGLAVEAAMRHYAKMGGHDESLWGLTGLLHDFDYERYPEPPAHTQEGAKILRAAGVDEEVVGAILSHAEWNLDDYPRDAAMRKTLFAVDELCGFIYAVALVRPERLKGMKPSSVKKKLKTASFAAAVSRQDIQDGAALLDLSLDEHIQNCINALTAAAGELGLEE